MVEATWSREDGQGKQAARYNERCYGVSVVLPKVIIESSILATFLCPEISWCPCRTLKETFGDIPTFAALQGKQLQFEGDQRPFKRCLAFQASQSRHSALSQGRISPSAVPEIDASAGATTAIWSISRYVLSDLFPVSVSQKLLSNFSMAQDYFKFRISQVG